MAKIIADKTPTLARVLCDGQFGKVDDVVEVPADVAAESGDLDPHPDAVAYAQSLKKPDAA